MVAISVSDNAYFQLKNLLNIHKEYSCIRLSYIKGCCKSCRVDIFLDDLIDKEHYITKSIRDIKFIYNKDFNVNINNIEIIYKDSSFMIKVIPNKNCSNCNSKSSSNSCNDCNSCNH
ncbi:hypothetical protein Z968_09440 [Clostridium novyi A str. 4552]|uniref:Uncharacterized protein n=1 Tax=Clostridium novyi A str. 4552 TaxID=1444289 RepID=A0A0A0I1M3_CLONO|nr:hypothetical protein [Clostridium novyi]KGM95294.1 hypothetical protein Z968_09440 [Clostridium novyi A str. 4552]